MIVLYLGPYRENIAQAIASTGDMVRHHERPLAGDDPLLNGAEYLVSYGFQNILRADVLSRLPGRCINLHISLLPWNRGRDPNLWSVLDNTPKGVTIHLIDEGVDTGDILLQQAVDMQPGDTLRTSYNRLAHSVEALFIEHWPRLRAGDVVPYKQPPGGTVHRTRDRKAVEHLLHTGWDTPIVDLTGYTKTKQHS